MKRIILIATILAAGSAIAGVATLTDSAGNSARCPIAETRIDAAGNVATACSGAVAASTVTPAPAPTPAPSPAPTPAPSVCPPAGSVDTGPITAAWPQHSYSPAPSAVTAFKISIPPGYAGRSTFYASQTSQMGRAKLLVVSTCPGVLAPVGGQRACSVVGTEASTLRMSGNAGDPSYYCKLTPGTYYVNAASRASAGGAYTCADAGSCSFYAVRSASN